MGHVLLGTLPDTKPWGAVVGLIAEGGDVAQVAGATIEAAQKGLNLAQRDPGLGHAVWLLAKIALAARGEDFGAELNAQGIRVPHQPSLYDLVGGYSQAMDRHLTTSRNRSDIGEMAQLARVETLTYLVGQRSTTLFGTTSVEVQQAVREFSTQKGFSILGHEFFARLAQRFLTYHLGRELSNHVGGNNRFANVKEHTQFVDDLRTHCREAALIVRDYSGGWYSKANFEAGITPRQARRFANYALTKLSREFQIRGTKNG